MKALFRIVLILVVSTAFSICSAQMHAQSATDIPQLDTPPVNTPPGRYDPKMVIRSAKSIFIHSKAVNLPLSTLSHDFMAQRYWSKLNLTIEQDRSTADLSIEIDRPQFVYVYTYMVIDNSTSKVLTSGKVTAINSATASGAVAGEVMKVLAAGR